MRWSLLAFSLAVTPAVALAQPVESPVQRGHALAAEDCSSCHDVEAHVSPGKHSAPSFRTIAAMPSTTPMAITAFLATPHPRMPNYKLSPGEIGDVSAYIMTLRPASR